ncbi:galactosyltransferase-related protein [Amycolatopsis sp. NPDC051373]|uniref:galactosyltransferase-related protein n=1 Tax=Amycolatopsis sp. NPDC051373 TaxID=3155801 RepID=UPI00344DD2D4
MTLAVLVPWHQTPDPVGAHRARLWTYLRQQWINTGVHLIAGSDPMAAETGRFSVSRALNNAARKAPDDVDMFALYGADHIPNTDVFHWAVMTLERQPWTPLHRGINYATPNTTEALLSGRISVDGLEWGAIHPDALCPGVLAVRRAAWDYVGGMDENFEQWGYEDSALVAVLSTVFPIRHQPLTPLFELWHPESARDLSEANPNRQRFEQLYAPAIGDPERILRVANAWRLDRLGNSNG